MSTKRQTIQISGLAVDVVRKNIKNLHLGVYPPDGNVRAAVPLRFNDDAVRLAVISRLGWIKRQQAGFMEQPRQPRRQFISRESHYFQGRRYLLNVVHHDGLPQITIRNRTRIDLYIREGVTVQQRERAFASWYRACLKEQIAPLIEKWSGAMRCEPPRWSIRLMKTLWGTCDPEQRRILLNLELAKKPINCLEYILVHEMVHLSERHHNARFTLLMDRFLPRWRLYRDELNSLPLRHENWGY